MHDVYVVSHASDIDGVGSAALIMRKYGVPPSRLFFSDYSREGLEYVHGRLRPAYGRGITLFITDLGVNDFLIPGYRSIVGSVKRGGGKVFWFDHHPWTAKGVNELAPMCDDAVIGENDLYCATEITCKKLGLSDPFTRNFVRLVHYSDFNLRPKKDAERKVIGLYALSITSYNMSASREYVNGRLRRMASVIRSGRLVDSSTKRDAGRFARLNESRIAVMLEGMEVRDGFAVGFSKDVQSTAGCGAIIERSGKPIGIYVNTRNGRGHIRSLSPDITELARSMGGGGHPRASGFSVDLDAYSHFRSASQRSRFADMLESRIRKFVRRPGPG